MFVVIICVTFLVAIAILMYILILLQKQFSSASVGNKKV